MQPTQLSLIPQQAAAPAADVLDQLPGRRLAAAMTLLARLIAQAADPATARASDAQEEAGDD